jgi:hypothetical protein
MAAALLLPTLLASDVAFVVIFGFFVVAMIVLIVITLIWVFRRDRALRAAWRQRQVDAGTQPYGIVPNSTAGTGDETPPAPRT